MHVGIDVASRTLVMVVHETQARWEVPNTAAGIATLRHALARVAPRASVVLEATGHWDLDVAWTLAEAGHPVRRLNPKQARDAARGWGQRAKTDAIDARVLARIAVVYQDELPPALPLRRQQALRELRAARRAFVNERKHYKQRLHTVTNDAVRAAYGAQIAHLTEVIATIEAELTAQLAAEPALAAEAQLLESIPGIGRQSAQTLVIAVPDLATSHPKQLASLLGLAPHAQDSGLHHGHRHCAGGRAGVRHDLWMAAVSARRHNPVLRAFADRLAAKHKAPKVILTAVLRKLIGYAHAILRTQTPWRYPSPA